jgi:hypothetical protein
MSRIENPQTKENKRESGKRNRNPQAEKRPPKQSKPRENRATRHRKNHPLSTVLIAAFFAA